MAIGSLDYLHLGKAKDRWGILLWLFPSPSAYPDMPLDAIESRLAELVADQSHRVEPRPPWRLGISGCLVTLTTRDHGPQHCESEDASYWKTEEFFDLRLLITDPRKVTVRPLRYEKVVDAVYINIPVREEAARRLLPVYRQYRQRVMHEIRRDSASGTYDLPARMDRLRAFTREQLSDRIFERKGERTFYCEAGTLVSPGDPREVRLVTGEAHAREVVELLHAYAVRACPSAEAALAPE